jgi:hypothetical protein
MIIFEEGSGFAAFALFNALKLHFTTDSYDFFKYHGKTNVSKDNFANRKDKYSFYKLSRKYRMDDLKNFYISNFLQKDVNWVGDISGIDGEEIYKKWQKRNQSLTYLFEQNIIGLLQDTNTPDEILKVRDGQYPLLLNEVMQGTIAIETLVILNNIMNFLPMWNKRISDTIIWPTWKRKIEKYSPFLIYDEKKFRNILKESIHEQA